MAGDAPPLRGGVVLRCSFEMPPHLDTKIDCDRRIFKLHDDDARYGDNLFAQSVWILRDERPLQCVGLDVRRDGQPAVILSYDVAGDYAYIINRIGGGRCGKQSKRGGYDRSHGSSSNVSRAMRSASSSEYRPVSYRACARRSTGVCILARCSFATLMLVISSTSRGVIVFPPARQAWRRRRRSEWRTRLAKTL